MDEKPIINNNNFYCICSSNESVLNCHSNKSFIPLMFINKDCYERLKMLIRN